MYILETRNQRNINLSYLIMTRKSTDTSVRVSRVNLRTRVTWVIRVSIFGIFSPEKPEYFAHPNVSDFSGKPDVKNPSFTPVLTELVYQGEVSQNL